MDADRPAPVVKFPRGRQFAVTWGIPDDFGGMTGAMLHRSRAFVRLAGTPVDILTFDARTDYPDVERRLREQGELVDGMRLLNLWDWLRENPLPQDAAGKLDLEKHKFEPLPASAGLVSARRGDVELSRTRLAEDRATVLQVDYYRADGTLLATDLRASEGRSVVLCDATGTPARSFGSIWGLYRFWLDLIRGGEPAFLVVDSKTIANSMLTYRRKRAVTLHVVHSSHLEGNRRPIGPLRESRRQVFEHLADFDSVVVLTDRQKRDVEALLGKVPNLAVVPNGREFDDSADLERPVGGGIVLASLTARKRVGHAVRAMSEVGHDVHLDIYGDGEERAALESQRDELGLGERVHFHGHDRGARAKLGDASFLLLTSTSEGFPLVLVEAMAAGCIPIAYDIPYGPADIIRDGVNGFLVPAGDQARLSAAIARLQSMSPREVSKMRRNARRAASGFTDLAVTKTWATTMSKAERRKAAE